MDDSLRQQALPTHVALKIKRNSDGTGERFKARTVAGGNFQTFGEDYFKTYGAVVSFPLVGIFLNLVLHLSKSIAQLDIETAFQNGELHVDVWVKSPRGVYGKMSLCYKLCKAMYELKQTHLARHKTPVTTLLDIGFKELPSVPCVFCPKFGSSSYSYILAYVDNKLILALAVSERGNIVKQLQDIFEVRV